MFVCSEAILCTSMLYIGYENHKLMAKYRLCESQFDYRYSLYDFDYIVHMNHKLIVETV